MSSLEEILNRKREPLQPYRLTVRDRWRAFWWPAQLWVERVWFCHHNARVLSDMEWRFGCVLNHVTRSMSKAYYTIEAMYAEIDDFLAEQRDEAYAEGQEDVRAEFNRALNFALDVAGHEAEAFLRDWREGQFDRLTRDWPEWAIEIAHPEIR